MQLLTVAADHPVASRRVPARSLVVVFSVALLLRLAFVAGAPVLYSSGIPDHYDVLAHNLIAGKGLSFGDDWGPTLARSPVFPLSIAAVYAISGSESVTVVRIASVVIDALTAALVVVLVAGMAPPRGVSLGIRCVLRWFMPRRTQETPGGAGIWPVAPVVAGLVYALQPFAAYWSAQVMIETLIAFLVVVSCVLAASWARSGRWRAALPLGLALGVLALTKSPALGLPILFATGGAVVLIRRGYRARGVALQVLAVLLLAGALVAPWTLRNWRLTHAVVPVQTLTWTNFWIDRAYRIGEPWPDTSHAIPGLSEDELPLPVMARTAREDVASERRLRDRAFSWTRAHPDQFTLKIMGNLIAYWIAVDDWGKNALMIALLLVQAPLAVGGVLWARRNHGRGLVALCGGLIVYFWLVHAAIFAYARYSAGVLPLFSVLVALGIAALCQRLRRG